MSGAGGETERHRDLKRQAVRWAVVHGFRACADEVRLPKSPFRADVAAAMIGSSAHPEPGETAVFECKQARADFLRDAADERETLARLQEISTRRQALEQMLGAHLPDLRRGESLFAECDIYDFESIRHDGLRAVRREEATLQAKIFGGTKFDRIRRYHCADRLYLVVNAGVMAAHEAPEGWGVLVVAGEELELKRAPARLQSSAAMRLALLQSIALAATRRCLANLDLAWDELGAQRATTFPT